LGTLTALAFAPALIELYGLVGACLTLLAANLFRIAAAVYMQKRITADEYVAV
jgi:hypothetical protein